MWRVGWWVGWGVLVLVRVVLLGRMASAGWIWAPVWCPELLALIFGVANAFMAKERDYSPGGLMVPACYLGGLWVLADVPVAASPVVGLLMVASMVVRLWALWFLGVRFSVAGSSWVSLVDEGPYRWVRHPQAASRLLNVLAVGLGASTIVDASRVALAGVLAVGVVFWEERALLGWGEWRQYAERVKWRFLPGVV